MTRIITKEGHEGIQTFIGIQFMLWVEDMIKDIVESGDEEVQKMTPENQAASIFDAIQSRMYGIGENLEKQIAQYIEEYKQL